LSTAGYKESIMSIEETRARLNRQIKGVIAESKINLTPAQQEQLPQLVSDITDTALVEFDALLGSMVRAGQMPNMESAAAANTSSAPAPGIAPAVAAPLPAEEILWQGRPFLSLGEHYVVTTQRVRMITGLFGKDREDIELIRIQDVDHTQGLGERVLNIGDVFLHSGDKIHPDIVLRNVTDPAGVHEIIRAAVMEYRRRYPFAFRQEL
jgi:hypothetical protein